MYQTTSWIFVVVTCLWLFSVVRAENDTIAYVKMDSPFVGGMATFELRDGEEFCLYQEFKESAKWILSYRVVRGGKHDVDIEVKNMKTKAIVYQEKKKHYEHFDFLVYPGLHSFCFSNKFSTFAHKYVFFLLTPVHPEPLEVEAGGTVMPKAKTLIETVMGEIHEHLTDIEESQEEHKAGIYEGIWVAYNLNFQVNIMSIFVLVAILVIGFGQVYLLRRLFDSPTKSSAIKPVTNVFVSPM